MSTYGTYCLQQYNSFHFCHFTLSACECNTVGTDGGTDICADDTGVCTCDTGFVGDKCDYCDVNYYGASCTPCTCSTRGTTSCDPATGACYCDTGYTGATCDSCDSNGYYDDSSSNECEGIGFLPY